MRDDQAAEAAQRQDMMLSYTCFLDVLLCCFPFVSNSRAQWSDHTDLNSSYVALFPKGEPPPSSSGRDVGTIEAGQVISFGYIWGVSSLLTSRFPGGGLVIVFLLPIKLSMGTSELQGTISTCTFVVVLSWENTP